MEIVFGFVTTLVQLAIVGGIIWAIVRAAGRRADRPDVDRAAAVRRLFVYGLLFATLVLTATGATLVLQEVTGGIGDPADEERGPLALGLAFCVVAGPAYGLLWRYARSRLRATPDERDSFTWNAYQNLALLVSLVVAIVAAQQALESISGVDDFEVRALMPFVVWAAVWAAHWFGLRPTYGLRGDVHLAAGSLAGLVPLTVGIGGMAYVAGDAVYTRLVERVPAGHDEPDLRSWAIAAAIGATVWAWHWLARYAGGERTWLWHVHVVLLGGLGGLAATVVSGATIGYAILVWFLGDPTRPVPSLHFEFVPVAAAVLVAGTINWRYHRHVLEQRREVRGEPVRAYDYLVAAAGLVAVVVALTLGLIALLEAVTPEQDAVDVAAANRLLLAATLAGIGGPLWWVAWSRIRRHVASSPADELGSTVRRLHLVVLFGVGGIVVLGSLIGVLFVGFQDLLEGDFGGTTVRSARVGLALVVSVTGVTWYHLGVFRSDREALAAAVPDLLPPPPASALRAPATHVVLVGPAGGTSLAEELAAALPADVDSWSRPDLAAAPPVDIDDLADRIRAGNSAHVLVVMEPDGTTVVPFEP